MRDATDVLRPSFVAYLDRLIATHAAAPSPAPPADSTTSPHISPGLTQAHEAAAQVRDEPLRTRVGEDWLTC
jgi:hypothetical protein